MYQKRYRIFAGLLYWRRRGVCHIDYLNEYEEILHELPDGRWVVAIYNEANEQYVAPMTEQEKTATGSKAFFGVELEDLECTKYESFEQAAENVEILFADTIREIAEWGII